MESSDVSLFRLASEAQLGNFLAPFEFVASVTTCASTLYALTSNGRILTLNDEFEVTGEAKLPPQRKQLNGDACISYMDVTGVLTVLYNCTLYFFRVMEKRAELLYSKSDVSIFALSSTGTQQHFPDHDLVTVTTRNQVVRQLLSVGEQSRERVLWKWRADTPVSSLAFDGACVCFTTNTGCYVYSLSSGASDPLLAFPIDRSQLPLNCPPPSICYVDGDTFAVAGCLPSMALFVDGSGSAARPPLVWATQHPHAVVRADDNLIIVGDTKLIIFDDSSSGRMRQELPLPVHACASCVLSDSLVIFTRSNNADIYCMRQLSWAQKANELLDKDDLENALYIASNNTIKTDEDLITYRLVHVRLGFCKLKEGLVDEGIQLLMQGQVTPFDVKGHFAATFAAVNSKEDRRSDADTVEKLISLVIDEEWAAEQSKEWATLLVIVRLRLANDSDIVDIISSSEDYDRQAVKNYCKSRKLANCLLVLESLTCLSSSLTLDWLDPALLPLIHPTLLMSLLTKISASDVELIYKWKDFVMESEAASVELLEFVRRHLHWFSHDFLLSLFESREEELQVVIDLMNAGSEMGSDAINQRFAALATERLSNDDISAEDSARLRKLLIDLILSGWEPNSLRSLIGSSDALRVERVVLENINVPEGAIQAIIDNVEYPGALPAIQQIMHHYSSSHPTLSKHFLHQLKRKCESDAEAASAMRLPEVMRTMIEASPSLIQEGAIPFIPDNAPLDTFTSLIARELQLISDERFCNSLARSLAQRISTTLVSPLLNTSVKVNEQSRCGVCEGRFDSSSSIHLLPSGRLVHPRCHPHTNICPITNELFRG